VKSSTSLADGSDEQPTTASDRATQVWCLPVKIVSHATYLPAYRVSRAEIAAFADARDTGERICAGGDEDSTTMAVAAAHRALEGTDAALCAFILATSTPVYADKSNATTVVCALDLDPATLAVDLGPSVRSGAAGLAIAAQIGGMAILSDIRQGHTGSLAERHSTDCASAVLFAHDGPGVAEVVGSSSRTVEVLDRWRAPGAAFGQAWEERFGESVYLRLVDDLLAWTTSLVGADTISHLAVTSSNPRAGDSAAKALRTRLGLAGAAAPDLTDIGDAGAASPAIALSRALDVAVPGELILMTSFADGYDALLVRKSSAPASAAQPDIIIAAPYSRYLRWRKRFAPEPERRPDPIRVSAPYATRDADFKFAFVGGRCPDCGQVQFPRPLLCLTCGGAGPFERVRGADSRGTVVTFTVDRLAMTPDPPLISAVIELDVGGRVQLEMTGVSPTELAPSTRVELVFRRLGVVDGIVNYFWKARPIGTG
jgi:hydroxymethylglutaryl-CoA synthase